MGLEINFRENIFRREIKMGKKWGGNKIGKSGNIN